MVSIYQCICSSMYCSGLYAVYSCLQYIYIYIIYHISYIIYIILFKIKIWYNNRYYKICYVYKSYRKIMVHREKHRLQRDTIFTNSPKTSANSPHLPIRSRRVTPGEGRLIIFTFGDGVKGLLGQLLGIFGGWSSPVRMTGILTIWKINMEHNNGGLVQMIFLFNWVIFRFHVNFQGFCSAGWWFFTNPALKNMQPSNWVKIFPRKGLNI